MPSRRALLTLLLIVLLIGGGALIARHARPAADRVKPRLALLTSLPLLFGEQFALDTPQVPAMARIEAKFAVVPIAVADATSLKGFSHLLMAHPRAQPAEVLVDLDRWVRDGGQVALLADPRLRWESSRRLGDPLRPPPDFADTGLLGHWGVRLEIDEAGEGVLRPTSRACRIAENGLVAECRVGRGAAQIIADADFLLIDDSEATRRVDLLLTRLGHSDSR
jgi:hypothetical protein